MRWPARCNVDLATEPLGTRQEGQEGLPQGHLADAAARSPRSSAQCVTSRCSPRNTPTCSRATPNWRKIAVKGGLTYAWDDRSTYVQNPPYFEGMQKRQRPIERHHRCARARPVPGFDHHRPHLAGRLDQGREPGRRIPARPSGAAEGLQPVRHAARQPRSHDARHLRQHPHQEPDGAGRRGRRDHPLSVASSDVDLRRGDALQGRGRAAGGVRGQGIRHRLVARLGGQGHARCSASAR